MNNLSDFFLQAAHSSDSMEALEELFEISLDEDKISQSEIHFHPTRSGVKKNGDRVIAEWLLFLHCQGYAFPHGWEKYRTVIFAGNPDWTLEKLCCFKGAVACFPLAGKGCPPKLVRLFVFETDEKIPDMRDALAGGNIFPGKYRIFFQLSESDVKKFDGKSWQLAAFLALNALKSPEFRKNLAQNWIATGEVCDGEVFPVETGNKFELKQKRKWLLPQGYENADAEKISVPSVERAWDWIIGKQIIEDDIALHTPVKVLFVLVGGAIAPVLSVALLLHPRKIVLWHSRETREYARKEKETLSELESRFPDIHMHTVMQEIPSDNIVELFPLFERAFNQPGQNIVVNVTGGNRLMGIAALLAAKQLGFPQVVYRDINDAPFVLQLLDFSRAQARNRKKEIVPSPVFSSLCWPRLFDNAWRPDLKSDIISEVFSEK